MAKLKVELSGKQQRFIDRILGMFGCVPPTYSYEGVATDKIVAVTFDSTTIKQLRQNAPHTKNAFHRNLCNQLADCKGLAMCSPEDEFDAERGLRLAKLRFIKKVASAHLGCYKQIHRDFDKNFQNKKRMIEETLTRIETAIGKNE